METALYGIRFVGYVTAMLLFGGSLVRVILGQHAVGIDRVLRSIIIVSALVSLASVASWLMVETANMGDGWSDAIDPATLTLVLKETQFGHLWIGRLAIGVLLIPVSIWGGWRSIVVVAGLSLASLADEGHGGIGIGMIGDCRLMNQGLHLLAGGLWLGGLLPLALLLKPGRLSAEAIKDSVGRFSGLGYGAVSIVLLTGCVNTAIFLGTPKNLLDTDWGLNLLIKIGFVSVTLGLAIINRTVIVPSFSGDLAGAVSRLRRTIYLEILSGLMILAAVTVLGTLAPPVS